MLSNTSKYALRAVIYLAMHQENGKKIGIKQIAKDLSIPSPFLGKILQSLAKQKLLASTKGPNGGFSLGRKAEDISLLDIVEIVDGLDSFNECLLGLNICGGDEEKHKICPMHKTSNALRLELVALFKGNTVGEVAKDLNKLGNLLQL